MTRIGQDAIDYARSRIGPNAMPASGYCLQFVRECFAVAAYYPSAIDAWRGCNAPHPGDRNPPAAVPVWFSSPSVYDHVAFFVGPHEVISTFNADVRAFDGIAGIEAAFNATYLGWGEDVNEVPVWYGETTDPGGDEFMSYLNYEEQRRVLLAADTWNTYASSMKTNSDRLPHIHEQVDWTAAQVNNNHNGILQILDILTGAGPSRSSRRAWLLVLLVLVLLAALVGAVVGILTADARDGAVTGAGVASGGLLAAVLHLLADGYRARREHPEGDPATDPGHVLAEAPQDPEAVQPWETEADRDRRLGRHAP